MRVAVKPKQNLLVSKGLCGRSSAGLHQVEWVFEVSQAQLSLVYFALAVGELYE